LFVYVQYGLIEIESNGKQNVPEQHGFHGCTYTRKMGRCASASTVSAIHTAKPY
jgi:hypothetical protein